MAMLELSRDVFVPLIVLMIDANLLIPEGILGPDPENFIHRSWVLRG